MAHIMPKIFNIHVSGTGETAARTELKARSHRVVVDEPVERGGTDLAATPLETMLSSYLACTSVIANLVAKEKGIEIDGIDLQLKAGFDTRGVMGLADVTIPFPNIEMLVDINTPASQSEIDELRAAVAVRCPISVILLQAGVKIEGTWSSRNAAS